MGGSAPNKKNKYFWFVLAALGMLGPAIMLAFFFRSPTGSGTVTKKFTKQTSGSNSQLGKIFSSEGEFLYVQRMVGYEFIGKFNSNFPAAVLTEDVAMDEITFTGADGTQHTYSDFKGYKLKVVKFSTNQGEMIYVLKSLDKTGN